ncbi:MAG TPA: hypothetical protein VMT19_01470 [Thermoanaerobaculaceae bacterium]|nr:hypothetical protein [Thermoanaerobaculaceae bacterium]
MPSSSRDRTAGAGPFSPGEDAVRSVLEAASARPDELPGVPPFFVARVKAAARARGDRRPLQLVAAVAWHALPFLTVIVVLLCAWAGLEVGRDADAQEDVAMVVLRSRDTGPDAPLTTLLLAGGETRPRGGGR